MRSDGVSARAVRWWYSRFSRLSSAHSASWPGSSSVRGDVVAMHSILSRVLDGENPPAPEAGLGPSWADRAANVRRTAHVTDALKPPSSDSPLHQQPFWDHFWVRPHRLSLRAVLVGHPERELSPDQREATAHLHQECLDVVEQRRPRSRSFTSFERPRNSKYCQPGALTTAGRSPRASRTSRHEVSGG